MKSMKSMKCNRVVLVVGLGLLAGVIPAVAQSKTETILNVGLRTADVVQTCYHLKQEHWREQWLHTQSCGVVAGESAAFTGGSFLLDRYLIKHGHPRLAHFQLVSAGGAGTGITYTFWPRRKR